MKQDTHFLCATCANFLADIETWGSISDINMMHGVCQTDACDICVWLSCLRSGLEVHEKKKHGECMLQVMYLFRNEFDGLNFSVHPHFTKILFLFIDSHIKDIFEM